MDAYHEVRSFHIAEDRFLFFDIFARNNELILICPAYAPPEEINYNNIRFFVSGATYKNCISYAFIENEPVVIICMQLESCQDTLTVSIKYNDVVRNYTLPHVQLTKKYTLTSTCLFLGDHRLAVPSQLYYASQGVEHFFYYFNQASTEPIQYLSNERTTLIPWGFRYWRWDKPLVHHAQLGQLNHALYKYGKPLSKYLINHDLDEYMHIRNQTLLELLQSEKICYSFRNYWCRFNELPVQQMPPKQFLRAVKTNGVHRAKYICKTDDMVALSVHGPKRYSTPDDSSEDHQQLLHFEGMSNGRVNTDFPYEVYTMPH